MAGRKRRTVADMVEMQKTVVAKAREKYDAEIEKLEKLIEKQDEENRRKILDAYEKSEKTVDEVIEFLLDGKQEGLPEKRKRGRKKNKINQVIERVDV